jgi:hypothetical protein
MYAGMHIYAIMCSVFVRVRIHMQSRVLYVCCREYCMCDTEAGVFLLLMIIICIQINVYLLLRDNPMYICKPAVAPTAVTTWSRERKHDFLFCVQISLPCTGCNNKCGHLSAATGTFDDGSGEYYIHIHTYTYIHTYIHTPVHTCVQTYIA